jgi:hypothetical protein
MQEAGLINLATSPIRGDRKKKIPAVFWDYSLCGVDLGYDGWYLFSGQVPYQIDYTTKPASCIPSQMRSLLPILATRKIGHRTQQIKPAIPPNTES